MQQNNYKHVLRNCVGQELKYCLSNLSKIHTIVNNYFSIDIFLF